MRRTLLMLSVTALLAAVSVPLASAQSWTTRPIEKDTYLSFSGPVSLPGVTLPAGTYLFRFVDPTEAPGVLSVTSKDGKTAYAMLHTIPIVRTETESNTSEVVTFREMPANRPPAIDAWYFDAIETAPGNEDTGCELIYSK